MRKNKGKKIPNRTNRSLECYLCKLSIKSTVSNLRRHIKLHGPFVKCYTCLGCKKNFQNVSNLSCHWVLKHETLGFQPKMRVSTRRAKSELISELNEF